MHIKYIIPKLNYFFLNEQNCSFIYNKEVLKICHEENDKLNININHSMINYSDFK